MDDILDNNSPGVLLEAIDAKFDALQEAHALLLHVPAKLDRLDQRLDIITTDIKALAETIKDLRNHTP